MIYAIVCGGRDFNQPFMFITVMNYFVNKYKIDNIVEGGAKGADRMAKFYAEEQGINCYEEKPDWKKYKKAAGPIRNEYMLNNYPINLVIGFKGGTGTMHMINYAKANKVPCFWASHENKLINWLTGEEIGDCYDCFTKE